MFIPPSGSRLGDVPANDVVLNYRNTSPNGDSSATIVAGVFGARISIVLNRVADDDRRPRRAGQP